MSAIQKLCRICLHNAKDSLDLFNGTPDSKALLNNVYLCFRITLSPDLQLPHLICNECVMELNSANQFRVKCEVFNDKLALVFREISLKLNSDIETSTDADEMKLECFEDSSVNENMVFVDFQNINEINNELENFQCGICGKLLKTKNSLIKHKISMHKKRKHIGRVTGFGSTRRYYCTYCSYSTPHSQTLVNHMRRHDGKRPFHCDCGKTFTQSSSLAAHLKTHSNITFFTCTECGKQFKHAYTLKKHISVHESGKFICNICHKILKSKQSLQEHMHRHYNIRNYNCEDCGDTFVTSSELINHKKKHSLTKKLECHLCGYKTHAKKSLVLHIKRHAGNKTFKCDLCEVTFYTQGEVRRHRRVHTREKPFSCPTCTQRFTYSPSLNRHMLMVHGVHYKWGESKSLKSNDKLIPN